MGNSRVSYTEGSNGNVQVVEENSYYAFGLQHEGYGPAPTGLGNAHAEKYKYNGKELQDELGLNMYDYGARNYDPAIGRWMNIDPLAEQSRRWSPYNYAYNNPIYFVDPDGMQADDWVIHYKDKNGKQQEFKFNGGSTALPDNKFVKSFVDSYRYNVANGGGDALKYVAENSNMSIDVQETNLPSFTDQPSSSPGSGDYNVLNWNPNMGLETTNGFVLSPATILEHEADHALKYEAAGKENYNKNLVEVKDKSYDNKEEKRVITGTEQRTARANNEIPSMAKTRTDHSGLPVITNSPTSNKVNPSKTVQYNQWLEKQGMFSPLSYGKYKKP